MKIDLYGKVSNGYCSSRLSITRIVQSLIVSRADSTVDQVGNAYTKRNCSTLYFLQLTFVEIKGVLRLFYYDKVKS